MEKIGRKGRKPVKNLSRGSVNSGAAGAQRDGGVSWILMLSDTSFATPGADCWNLGIIAFFDGSIRSGSQLDEGVKRDIHPRRLFLRLLHEVGVDATEDGLMCNDQYIFRSLQLHDNWLKADNDVPVTVR
jgi:hypothetical protein